MKGIDQYAPTRMLVSELGSLSLEFTRLTQLTKDPKYYDAVQRISDELYKGQNTTKLPGLWPIGIDAAKPAFDVDNMFTLGGMSDSLYEYFPKQFLILGGVLSQPKIMYETFIEVAKQHMFFRIYNPDNKKLTVSGDIRAIGSPPDLQVQLVPRGQHLTCFTGGMVGLASQIFNRPQDLSVAEELTNGCIFAYDSFQNGISPEIFEVMPCPKNYDCEWDDKIWWKALNNNYGSLKSTESEIEEKIPGIIAERRTPKGFTSVEDRRYILRPEAIESVFIMWRITGKKEYQDAAWRMFQAVERVSRTEIAAAAIWDITIKVDEKGATKDGGGIEGMGGKDGMKMDSMESFWLAETLKYFYLCFEEWGVVSLDEWVLNTEAHPMRRGDV